MRSSISHGGNGADEDPAGRDSIAPSQRGTQQEQGQGPAGEGGRSRGCAPGQVGRDDEGAGPEGDCRAGAGQQATGEGMVSERAVRVDVAVDHLGDRIAVDDVDALERRNDRLLGPGQGQGRGGQAAIGPALCGCLVDRQADLGQPALAARWGRLAVPDRPGPRMPGGDLEAGVVEPIGQLAAGRHVDPDDIDTGGDEVAGLARPIGRLGLGGGHPYPGPGRVTDQGQQLEPGGPVGVDPVEGGHGHPAGQLFDGGPSIGIVEDLGLEPEVDRTRGHVEGERLRTEVVFAQRRDEGQGDPGAKPVDPARRRTGRRQLRPVAGRPDPGR